MLLQKGSTGENVTYLQYGLYIMCCNPGGFDGDFGDGTFAAVEKFQTNFGLSVDGVVGDDTWNTLSSEIRSIQIQLNNKGFNIGAADGVAGPNTYNGVIAFQKAKSLTQDGMVGPATKTKLFDSGYDDSAQPTLQKGAKGDAVKKLQTLLISKGYSVGSYGADGDFGDATYNAVFAFQGDHNLVQDGIVGPATWAALTTTPNSSGQPTLQKGAKGDAVGQLQALLISKGYSCGPSGEDNDFGDDTYNAVIAFQKDHGLVQDGIVGSATWAALTAAPSSSGQPTLQKGAKGDAVKKLQSLLISKGYSVGSYGADGDFGDATYNAVFAFQGDQGLAQDGIVGPATWAALLNPNTSGKPVNSNPGAANGPAGGKASANLIYFIKQSEGFAPSLYHDVVGVLTGGYGMTGSELNGLPSTISEATATSLLANHVNNLYYIPVLNAIRARGVSNPLQREVDAFTSFAYNVGVGAFKSSTLLSVYASGARGQDIHDQFMRWVYAGNTVYAGLVTRRTREWNMFSGSSASIPGYNCKPSISYVNTAGNSTAKVVTDNNGYGASPY